jgi:hypothetical protein
LPNSLPRLDRKYVNAIAVEKSGRTARETIAKMIFVFKELG